ncbi:hypothetical protein UFOVP115_15 [uncultured Caudovirales phage]|uniref:Uncharacterized protein n=1 Tax=uncultured Caudovirales phage TaxID=2100421 RepID=A0A6J5L545_9CAUD|nr:hypothetical protein UFOVP115_15 [uncultured Caudovirales phage]
MAEKKKTAKKPALGQGGRFKAIEEQAKKSGAKNPAAVAAAAGIKKYGEKNMVKLEQKGKRDAKKGGK